MKKTTDTQGQRQIEPTELEELIREFIESVLDAQVLTVQELADFSGLSRSTLSHWINGKRSMTLRNAGRMLKVLGYDGFYNFVIYTCIQRGVKAGDPDPLSLLRQVNGFLRQELRYTIEEKCRQHDTSEQQHGERPMENCQSSRDVAEQCRKEVTQTDEFKDDHEVSE